MSGVKHVKCWKNQPIILYLAILSFKSEGEKSFLRQTKTEGIQHK